MDTEVETRVGEGKSDMGRNDTEKTKSNNSVLDIAFAMDCTGSMGSYIDSARNNIRQIVEDIVSSEKADVQLALVEYRDHPPQDSTFVTRVNDFTGSVSRMKKWLENCSASGGGDTPEAVADALHDVTKLSWRPDSTKICVFISDAPPHGLSQGGDHFPNGCPAGLDPMKTIRQIAEKGITLYMVGCEPSITPYKTFFCALAHTTGGQYVPLVHAGLLRQVIVGGAQEEISLEQLMAEVQGDVIQEAAAQGTVNEDDLSTRLHEKMKMRGVKTKQLRRNNVALDEISMEAKAMSICPDMKVVRSKFKPSPEAMLASGSGGAKCMKKKKSGSSLRSFFTLSRSAPMACAAPVDMLDEVAASDFAPPEDISYDNVEDEISYNQVQRMVKKSMMQNNLT